MLVWACLLPYPPSVNRLWRYTSRGVYRTKSYTDWLSLAGAEINVRPGIEEPCKLEIKACPPDKRRRDIDNIIKPLMDCLEENCVIQNDSLVHELAVCWDYTIEKATVYLILTTPFSKRIQHGRRKQHGRPDTKNKGVGRGSEDIKGTTPET